MRKLALTILVLLMIGIFSIFSWAGDKILPIDYMETDRNSREIWFEFDNYFTKSGDCFWLIDDLFKGKKVQIMRNGNIIVTYRTGTDGDEFLSLKVVPKSSLVAVSGINGLKFGKTFNFEFTQDINLVQIKYAAKEKKNRSCQLIFRKILLTQLRERQSYELAHVEAVKLARNFGNVAPSFLQQRTRETVPPSISSNTIFNEFFNSIFALTLTAKLVLQNEL